jgi:hypothetical protein
LDRELVNFSERYFSPYFYNEKTNEFELKPKKDSFPKNFYFELYDLLDKLKASSFSWIYKEPIEQLQAIKTGLESAVNQTLKETSFHTRLTPKPKKIVAFKKSDFDIPF